jgi:signal transduction histidine kinase
MRGAALRAGPLTAMGARLPLPRRTVRLRLTLLYGALFLVSGIGLLVLTNVLVRHATGDFVLVRGSGEDLALGLMVAEQETDLSTELARRGQLDPAVAQEFQAQAQRLRAQAAEQHDAELRQLLIQSGIALSLVTVLSIGLGWLVAGRVLRPLRTITSTVRDISATNLHRRLALSGPDDELKELGDTFDDLLSRLQHAFDAQRQFVANASHELRTPLARQRTLMEVALSDPDATVDSLRASYERALASGEEQARLIEALLTLARSERGLDKHEPLDLATVAGNVLLTARPEQEWATPRWSSAL